MLDETHCQNFEHALNKKDHREDVVDLVKNLVPIRDVTGIIVLLVVFGRQKA